MLNGESSVNGIKINGSKYKKKQKQKKFARAARFAVHSFAVVLYCR